MSIGMIARMRPVNPPMVNTKIKPTANSIGVSKLIEPRHMVVSQLNTLTPVGTAISTVAYMKNRIPAVGMPTVNMWCAQTMNERIAIEAVAYTIEEKPNKGFLENAGITWLIMPKPGRIMM